MKPLLNPAKKRSTGHAAIEAGDYSTTLICHLVEHRPLAFYAERLGISPAHLNRLARLNFGETVRALIDWRLIAAARHELVFSRFPAQWIAFSLGFSDPGYFNRFFRKKTGMRRATAV